MRQQRRIGGLAALMTTSPESVWPDETLYGEFPWLTTTLMSGPSTLHHSILSASGAAGI
jgi:hypothetical protein